VSAAMRLYVRLTRRGVLLLAFGIAAYSLVEAISYAQTYPDEASRLRLAEFGDQPAVRMLQGIPHAVATVGGFVVWDGGWFMQAIIGVWAILVTSRLLRGEEESGRSELVASGALSAVQTVSAALMVVFVGCGLAGLASFVALIGPTGDVLGAALFAAALAGFGAVMASATAVAAQLVGVRRRAAAMGAAFLGVAFVLRMVANSADDRAWVGWLSVFGWMDRLRAFGDNVAWVLLVYVVVICGLTALALQLRLRRDAGAAWLSSDRPVTMRPLLLKSPVRFAWRLTWGVLLAWAVGIGLYSLLMGSLVQSMQEVLADDPSYEVWLDLMGIDPDEVAVGMVSFMAVVVGLVTSLYAAWRMGAVRNEEDEERAEHLLTRPLPRWRWLGGHLLLGFASVLVLVGVTAVATWAGAAMTDAGVTLADTLAAASNQLPVILLFGGLAVAMFGLAPRLTVAVPVGAVVVSYILSFVGPALELPGWVIGLSPFYHLAMVPLDDYGLTQGLVLLALAAVATAVGVRAFQRRDIVGA
jgi:ABC-2 type transport system permease protein